MFTTINDIKNLDLKKENLKNKEERKKIRKELTKFLQKNAKKLKLQDVLLVLNKRNGL